MGGPDDPISSAAKIGIRPIGRDFRFVTIIPLETNLQPSIFPKQDDANLLRVVLTHRK